MDRTVEDAAFEDHGHTDAKFLSRRAGSGVLAVRQSDFALPQMARCRANDQPSQLSRACPRLPRHFRTSSIVELLNVEIYPISLVPAPTLPRLQSARGGKVIGDVTIPRVRVSRFAGPQSNLQLLGLEDRVVTVHSLRCLRINRELSSELESALRRISLPSLSELTISLDDGYDDSATGIYPLIQRSNASLKLLRLIYVGIEYDELYGVLRESPMLETLCILDWTAHLLLPKMM